MDVVHLSMLLDDRLLAGPKAPYLCTMPTLLEKTERIHQGHDGVLLGGQALSS
jgi:hypothetical protein